MEAMGLKMKELLDEEWSYIPVGGPLPIEDQSITAFGAAANLIHPSSGYSISRSLREAPKMAAAIEAALASDLRLVQERSQMVWASLWSPEKRTQVRPRAWTAKASTVCWMQASFHVFGMELLAQLELPDINRFFDTFFRLPAYYWKGFLSSSIDSTDLVVFAMLTLLLAPPSIKTRLLTHLMIGNPTPSRSQRRISVIPLCLDASGRYVLRTYFSKYKTEIETLLGKNETIRA